MEIVKPIIDLQALHIRVEHLVTKDKMSYCEAICEVCEQLEIEPQDIAKIIKGTLKEKLHVEAQRLNIITKSTTGTLFA